WDHAQLVIVDVLDRDFGFGHRCHANERADLDHVGQHAVRRAPQAVYALDGEQVGADARDLGAHAVEHLAELLQVGLAGRVVDRGGSFGQHGGHHHVGRAREGCLIQQQVGAAKPRGVYLVEIRFRIVLKLGSQFLKTQKMRVQSPPPDFVAAGLGNGGFAKARQQGANNHDGSPQAASFVFELLGLKVIDVDVFGAKTVAVFRQSIYFHTQGAEQFNQLVDVLDVGDVAHYDFIFRQ